jgi:hypothetical protein
MKLFFNSHKLSGLHTFHINRTVTEMLNHKVSFTEAFVLEQNGGVTYANDFFILMMWEERAYRKEQYS